MRKKRTLYNGATGGVMDVKLIGQLLSIVVVNLVLSGDNAVVIAMAARRLPSSQRSRAIVLGGAAAVGLRIVFTALAAFLLKVPMLEAIGGLVLVYIAITLLSPESETESAVAESSTLLGAIKTIVIADLAMSLDNILAIAGVAEGHLWLMIVGLVLSIPIILAGSGLVTFLMTRLPWLAWVGAGILAYAAGEMIATDPIVGEWIDVVPRSEIVLPAVCVAVALAVALVVLLRHRRRESREPVESGDRDSGAHVYPRE